MTFKRGDRQAERDWTEHRMIDKTQYDELCGELDGEPTNDGAWVLSSELHLDGGEGHGKWRVERG